MKTRHCDECKHPIPGLIVMQCAKGHKPRFYKPNTYVDNTWGYKRKCADFEPKELSK